MFIDNLFSTQFCLTLFHHQTVRVHAAVVGVGVVIPVPVPVHRLSCACKHLSYMYVLLNSEHLFKY